jgi:septal ring factor EnvC (AmiA/AmiB activator)
MSEEGRLDRIEQELAAVNTGLDGINQRLDGLGDRVTSLEAGQTELVATVTGIDRRLTKVEITQEAMRDDIKALAEGHAATQAAIAQSTDRVIAYIDERISPIEQAVRHLSR